MEGIEHFIRRGVTAICADCGEETYLPTLFNHKTNCASIQGLKSLTKKELEIAILIAEGQRTKDVANKLGISHKTVDCHRTHIYRKLAITGVAQLTRKVLESTVEENGSLNKIR